jgi:site-specific recombinase XerD
MSQQIIIASTGRHELVLLHTFPANFVIQCQLQNESGPYGDDCQIKATNDLEAVACWLNNYKNTAKTLDLYQREAERLLLWCTYERGLPLRNLKVADLEAYLQFLQKPPAAWCTNRATLRAGKSHVGWRPFVQGLTGSSFLLAARVLNSLFNYLVSSEYVKHNPFKLLKTWNAFSLYADDRKYQIWERMLMHDEWQAVQATLEALPENDRIAELYKYRTQLLFAMLYFLGLRINEVAQQPWGAFQLRDGKWWFFVKGKGGKHAHLPVHDQLMFLVRLYRLQLGQLPEPTPQEATPIFVASKTQQALSVRQLYNMVKSIGKLAAASFPQQPEKQRKLTQLSPHWLRHLFASHQDEAGIHPTIIKANMRHSSIHTTQLYLHAEDNARHAAVQKLTSNINKNGLLVTANTLESSPGKEYLLQVTISRGGINWQLGIRNLVKIIETKILARWHSRWRGAEQSTYLQNINRLFPESKLQFSWNICGVGIDLPSIEAQILFEAQLRLFEVKVNIINGSYD